MVGGFRAFLVTFCALIGASPLWAQVPDQSTDQMRQRAEQSLTAGDATATIGVAETLLRRDPEDYQALMLLSLAKLQLGQNDEAANAAGRAFRAGQADDQKLQAARVAAAARFNTGQYTRAEWWLRRAANHTRTEEDSALLEQEFQAIRQNNPLFVQLNFSVARSNNINGGSEDAFFFLDDFQFILDPASRALSGTEYQGEVELSYRLSASERQATFAGLYLYGRTYTLSGDSQATVPDVSGSDYSLTVAEVSLRHRRLLFDGLGPTTVSVHTGQMWYGGDSLRRFNRLALAQDFLIGQNAATTIQALIEDQETLSDLQPDTVVYDVQGTYAQRLGNQDIVRLSLGYRLNDADEETFTFTDYRATVEYDFEDPVLSTDLSVSFGVGHTNYDEFSLSLDGRRDTYASVGATAVFSDISYFGFSPSVSLSIVHTDSNVSRFSNTDVQGSVGISSNF